MMQEVLQKLRDDDVGVPAWREKIREESVLDVGSSGVFGIGRLTIPWYRELMAGVAEERSMRYSSCLSVYQASV